MWCSTKSGRFLSQVLFALCVSDLTAKLIVANLGCSIGSMSICCLFYADDIVVLATSWHFFASSLAKLQLMLNLRDFEMQYLD